MPVTSEELYARDEKLKREDVQTIQEWLKRQPHLPHVEEYQVILFLHSCYYQIEQTKTTIDKYFTQCTRHPHIFHCIDENTLRNAMKFTFASVLPEKTLEGYAVFLIKHYDFDPRMFVFLQFANVINLVWELYTYQYGFANGCVVVYDSRGFSFSHLLKVNLSVLNHGLCHTQEATPIRIKGIHCIYASPVVEKLKILTKPFLHPELYNAIEFHEGIDTLYELVPQECFPEEYGGRAPSCQILQEQNLGNLLANYEFFHRHDSQKVDESRRPRAKWSIFGWSF